MSADDVRFTEKKVDESWKERVAQDSSPQADKPKAPEANPAKPSPQTSQKFIQFMTSIAIQVLIQLGDIENPMTQTKELNIDAARDLIDILIMLKEKTRGNLTAEEIKAFKAILADLQLKFVEASNQTAPKETGQS